MKLSEFKKYKHYDVIGLIEPIKIFNNDNESFIELKAKIDSGADTSSIDLNLLSKLKLSPIQKVKKITSANGKSIRPVILAEIELKGKRIKEHFTVIDRSHLRYKVLIGKNILKKHNFLIDPNKKD